MNNRQDIITEYQSLVRKLNLSNRLKNQQTEIRFYIQISKDERLILFCTANNEFALRIGYLKDSITWYPEKEFEFQIFAQYILKKMQGVLNSEQAHLAIVNALRILFAIE